MDTSWTKFGSTQNLTFMLDVHAQGLFGYKWPLTQFKLASAKQNLLPTLQGKEVLHS